MIQKEYFMREDGVQLVKTYSDQNFYLIQDGTGAMYSEAIDPVYKNRSYTESDVLVEKHNIEDADNIDTIDLLYDQNDEKGG